MMVKRTNRLVWGLVVGLAGIGFWGLCDSYGATRREAERRKSEAGLKRAMIAQLPRGADLSAVLKFLDERRISHTTYYAGTRHVSAHIPYAPHHWFQFEGGFYMVFWFTKDKKLANYTAREAWRGL